MRYVVEEEWAETVDDVARRTHLGLGACGGLRCAARCGAIVAQITGRSPLDGRRMALAFLEAAARRRAPCVGPEQARAEALLAAQIRAQLGAPPAEHGPDRGPLGFEPGRSHSESAASGAERAAE